VDDSPLIRRILRSIFERRGWEVCGEAEDGKAAIEKTQRLRPDIVVLDLSMPVMNGLEAARELKRINPSLPLIMYTTFSTPHLEREAIASGCSALIPKEESLTRLIDRMHQLLEAAA